MGCTSMDNYLFSIHSHCLLFQFAENMQYPLRIKQPYSDYPQISSPSSIANLQLVDTCTCIPRKCCDNLISAKANFTVYNTLNIAYTAELTSSMQI